MGSIIIGLIFILIGFVFQMVKIHYEYETKIGAYIENAYEVNTPHEMMTQVELAIEGMENEGLENDDYGAYWFKKPDNKMSWQYTFLSNFTERAEAVEVWYNQTYNSESNVTETMGDVYEQKMDNLREFLKENGRADWIAKNAWYLKNYTIFYFQELIVVLLFVLLFVVIFIEVKILES